MWSPGVQLFITINHVLTVTCCPRSLTHRSYFMERRGRDVVRPGMLAEVVEACETASSSGGEEEERAWGDGKEVDAVEGKEVEAVEGKEMEAVEGKQEEEAVEQKKVKNKSKQKKKSYGVSGTVEVERSMTLRVGGGKVAEEVGEAVAGMRGRHSARLGGWLVGHGELRAARVGRDEVRGVI